MTEDLKKQILQAVKTAYPDVEIKPEDITLEHPGAQEHGDYSTNIALKLAKQLDKNPQEVAKLVTSHLSLVTRAEIAGPGFINFKLSTETLVSQMALALEEAERYGSGTLGAEKTVVIDYSAPNIAKRFGIGHLRSTIIGQAIYNLLTFQGYKVIGDNHLGDWGTQFGKIIYMIVTEKPQELTIDKLEELYVKFHQMAEKDPELENKGREWFKKLENGDLQARELWKKCIEISLAEFDRIYRLLNVKIDHAYGESFYEDKMPQVIKDAKKITKESNGALIIEIPGIKAPLMLVKSDGGTTYATRDLATLKFRREQWNPDVVIYEVGAEQTLYFSQLFAVARMLEYVKPEAQLVHTKHGLYRWPHGKFSTREGNTIKLEQILDEAIARAKKFGNEQEETAKAVGIGAVKYFDLKHSVQNDIVFDWENMFALEGDSGPYLQYTYARARSVLRKSGVGAQRAVPAGRGRNGPTNEELSVLRFF